MRGIAIDAAHQELQTEREAKVIRPRCLSQPSFAFLSSPLLPALPTNHSHIKNFLQRKLSVRVEELLGYLDRTKNTQEADSAINMEYLKTCVYRFMASTELSERRRLYPVIATILKLTSLEKAAVEAALQAAQNVEPLQSLITNFWG